MTTIEKIRAEIERLKGICTAQIKANPGQTFPFVMEMTGYDKLLSFLSTLESEMPISQNEDFEKEIADYWTTMGWSKVMTLAKFKVIARYFYGLGLGVNDKSENPMNQDELEEAVVDYFEGYWPGMETAEQCNTDLHFTPPAIMRLARHFVQWGAEHSKR